MPLPTLFPRSSRKQASLCTFLVAVPAGLNCWLSYRSGLKQSESALTSGLAVAAPVSGLMYETARNLSPRLSSYEPPLACAVPMPTKLNAENVPMTASFLEVRFTVSPLRSGRHGWGRYQ